MGYIDRVSVGGTTYDVADSRADQIAPLHNLVNYNYSTDISLSQGDTAVTAIGVARHGTRVTLNGTETGSTYWRVRLSGSGSRVSGNPTAANTNAGYVTLNPDHRYRISVIYVSGTATRPNEDTTYVPYINVYEANATSSISIYSLNGATDKWFYPPSSGKCSIWLCAVAGCSFTNAVYDVIMEDLDGAFVSDEHLEIVDASTEASPFGIEAWGRRYSANAIYPNDNKSTGVSITKTGNLITVNGTYTKDGYLHVGVIGDKIHENSATDSTVYSAIFSDSFVMRAGHTYKIGAEILSGSITSAGSLKTNLCWYTAPTGGSMGYTNFTSDLYSSVTGGTTRWAVYTSPSVDTKLSFGFYFRKTSVTFSDVVIRLTCEDETGRTRVQSIAQYNGTDAAATNYASGDLLMWNGRLYTATTAIASGETLVSGTNVTATSVATQLAARDTAIAAEATERAAVDSGLDGRINAVNGLVNYDYDTMFSGTLGQYNLTATRAGTRLMLNGTVGSGSGGGRIRLNGTPAGAWTSTNITSLYANSTGIKLVNGHIYRLYVHAVSGTLTNGSGEGSYIPSPYIRDKNTDTSLTESVTLPNGDKYLDFTYTAGTPTDAGVLIMLTQGHTNGLIFTNFVMDIVLYDITYGDYKLPLAPTTDGTYTLKVTVSSGVPTYSWVADT